MKRLTILSLMGFILAVGVAIAALRNADDNWAGAMILSTPLLLGVALIGALCGEERSRARRLGFAILGGGYFALAFLGLSDADRARLPTARLLQAIHERVAPQVTGGYTVTYVVTSAPPGSGQGTFMAPPPNPASINVVPGPAPSGSIIVTPGRWKSFLPGAANLEAFRIVGHCLFALLVGLLGAAIAQWFRGRYVDRRVIGDDPATRTRLAGEDPA
jgi:hypothetical protein